MAKQEMPEWFTIIVLIIIMGALFPFALMAIINSILLGIMFGVLVAVVIVVIWFLMKEDYF